MISQEKLKEFREHILDLAIKGKLVEQRPEDGTAEDLYQQIQEEKQKLIKEGKLKKEKPLVPIEDEEIPFEIPKSWMWVRLSTISLRLSDGPFGSNLKKEHYTENKEVRIIQLSNIGLEGWKNENCKYTTFEHLKNISRSEVFPGDIVIAKMMPAGRAIIVPNTDSKYVLSSDAVGVSLDKDLLDIKYVNYVINSDAFRAQVCKEARGTTRVRTSLGKLKTYCLPLPPLSEQKRIVAKLELSLSVIKKAEELLKRKVDLDAQIKEKILQMAVQGKIVEQRPEEGTAEDLYQQIQEEKQKLIKEGKLKKEKPLASIDDEIPFDIPENWKWVRVGSIGSWGAGSTPSRTNSSFYGGDIPWLKTGDLTDGNVDKIPEKITLLALEKCSLKVNPIGSVLIAMYGATIGKLGILTVPATTNQACCACSVFNGMFNKYLFYFLMSRRDSFTKIAVGGAQPNISKEKIVNSIIPLPPLAEQKRIVAKVEELLALCDKLKLK